jgi:hypothetical protein
MKNCDDVWPMTEQERRLCDQLLEAADFLFVGVSVKPEVVDSLRDDARKRISLILDYLNRQLAPRSPLFARELAALASLCMRLYRGTDSFPPPKVALWILDFFVYFQYPIDLDNPEPDIDESFLEPPARAP